MLASHQGFLTGEDDDFRSVEPSHEPDASSRRSSESGGCLSEDWAGIIASFHQLPGPNLGSPLLQPPQFWWPLWSWAACYSFLLPPSGSLASTCLIPATIFGWRGIPPCIWAFTYPSGFLSHHCPSLCSLLYIISPNIPKLPRQVMVSSILQMRK